MKKAIVITLLLILGTPLPSSWTSIQDPVGIGGFFSIPIAHALNAGQVCAGLNNQLAAADSQSGKTNELAGKFFTITEEPLGPDQKDFSFRCARMTSCVFVKTADIPEAQKASTKAGWGCEPEYTTVDSCTTSSNEEVAAAKESLSEFTTCEIVQVYVAGAGTDLLYQYIGQIYRYVAQVGGLLAVLIMIYSGIMIASSGSNPETLNKAKARITRCITGLILLFLTSVILYVINPNFFVI